MPSGGYLDLEPLSVSLDKDTLCKISCELQWRATVTNKFLPPLLKKLANRFDFAKVEWPAQE